MPFEQNVFINCPFDASYIQFLRPLLFTVIYCGLDPQIAQTNSSFDVRLDSIKDLIEVSKYSIHDLSNMAATKKGELARFNMPFELGIDYGSKRFGGAPLTNKSSLIIDKASYRYQAALSDIAGCDIANYKDSPEQLVRAIRYWINDSIQGGQPHATVIWNEFNEFVSDFQQSVYDEGGNDQDIEEMSRMEYIEYIKAWVQSRP